jgi:glucose/arabinose dehydrogenase
VLVSGLHRPNGLAYHNGALYIAEVSKISKIDNVEETLDDPPKPTVVYDGLPKDEAHGARFIAVGPDGKLYIAVGQPCNNCVPPAGQGEIRRIDLDGGNMAVVARGVRNSVGFDWSPRNKQLYFTDNGRDWLSEDAPNDELNRVSKPDQDFGAPYCYQGNLPDTQFGWGRSCDEFTAPIALLGPHVAPLGMRFYSGRMFPREYRGVIFIARHGSWNRTKKIGGDVIAIHLNKSGTVSTMEPFLTGFLADNNYLGRPVDVQPMHDGSLLISDDWNGAVYRITYGRRR